MRVWAIADLHLSFARPDRRERFAGRWLDHAAQIERHWREAVGRVDVVLLPGDLSMAGNHREVQPDLAWLDRLPGLKVLAPGNHDRWWNKVDRVRPLLRRGQRAVDGDAVDLGGLIACGARGAPALSDDAPPADRAALERELASLDASLARAVALRTGNQPIYALWHHPPFDPHGRPGPAVARLEAAGVDVCVYGHLHIAGQWSRAVQGRVGAVEYHCVAADAVGFRPLRVDPGRRSEPR